MKALGLALAIALTSAPAEACHRFSVWNYLYPQRCPTIARHEARRAAPMSFFPPSREAVKIDIALPTLELIDWGQEADDEARGRLELRAMLGEK
jgi:hypothetical protein